MRILVADDQPLDRSVLKMTLEKWDYEVVEAANGSEALGILKGEDAPTLAVLDWMMPGMSGPEVCREVRKCELPRYTYMLLITSRDEKDDIVEGLDSGADDYIVKPVDVHELQVRLRAGRRIVELQEELITTREALREQATRDFLTGVWNRAVIMEKIVEEVDRSSRRGESLGTIMCDIDHFKQVNDTYGHSAGDAVLVEVARRISETLRAYDAVGRYGGEEFLVVAPDAELDGTVILAERIRKAVSASAVVTPQGPIEVTLSLGVTAAQMEARTDCQALIDEADRALYAAKEGGRDRVEVAKECAATQG